MDQTRKKCKIGALIPDESLSSHQYSDGLLGQIFLFSFIIVNLEFRMHELASFCEARKHNELLKVNLMSEYLTRIT